MTGTSSTYVRRMAVNVAYGWNIEHAGHIDGWIDLCDKELTGAFGIWVVCEYYVASRRVDGSFKGHTCIGIRNGELCTTCDDVGIWKNDLNSWDTCRPALAR